MTAAILLLLLPPGSAAPPEICAQPLAPFDAGLLATAERGIAWLYGFEVRRLPARDLPREAWTEARQRHRADVLLDWLDRTVAAPEGCGMVVGFTAADISTTKEPYPDWGVFGLGTLGGPSCVASTFRLAGWPKKGAAPDLVARRTVKVVNHEVGHVLGLPHTDREACLMEDAHGSIATVDGETGLLCDEGREAVIRSTGWTPPDPPAFDWEAVTAPR